MRSTAVRTTSIGDGNGGQTSSTIWMSAPSSSCVATADSGVNRWVEPSYTDRNVTPSSSTFGSSENTWNPPLSVSVSPRHPANAPRPPNEATVSAPGRSIRW